MRAVRWPTLVATLSCLIGCLGDPVGPRGTLVVRRLSPLDSAFVGAPGRPLPTAITFEALDGDGRPVSGAVVRWTVTGTKGRVEQAPAATDARGQFSAVWVLGTRASDQQGLAVTVQIGKHSAAASVAATAKPVEVSSVAFSSHDTTTVKLGVATPMSAQASDPFGNQFMPVGMRFGSLDTTLCTVDSLGVVQARKRGFGRIVVVAGSAADTAWVHPTQVVQAIIASPDTLRFHSLGQTATLTVQLVDDQGRYVRDSLPADSVQVDAVVKVQPGRPYAVRSISNGTTPVILRAGVVAQAVQVLVNQRIASVKLSASRTNFDALGDTVQLTTLVSDSLGTPLTNQVLAYFSADTSVAKVGPSGFVTSRGNGSTWIYTRAANGVADSVRMFVAQLVARVVAKRDSILLDALQAVLPVQATAVDRLGAAVATAALTYATGAASIATVDASGSIRAIANGSTSITAAYGSDTAVVAVRVAQRPVRVVASSDTVRFVALGETQVVQGVAVDSLGYPVSSMVRGLGIADTTVVQQVDSVTVRSHANGSTRATFSVAGLPVQMAVVVSQVPTRMTTAVTYGESILTLSVGAPIPLTCEVFDRNGYPVPGEPSLTGSVRGTVTGTVCSGLQAQRSGNDTLTLTLGPALARVPLTMAIAPVVSAPLGVPIAADTLPGETSGPWAPSARRNQAGQIEVYYTAWSKDSTGISRGDLHRLLWLGGNQFRYDSLVLKHDDDICSPQGAGIENMVIVPRADRAGWRMLYAAGSNECYGWQVFSAVSADGRTWSKEPGIRVSNGGGGAGWPPWPAGEGMVVDRLPSGEWRMIVATFEHISPAETTKWQITEWRSPDQLQWSYVGPVLTTRQMPPGWQGSVYSPTIRQIAPGLWRMLFTANDRSVPGSGDAMWSAVSTDLANWQVEGELLGGVSSMVYYASLVDDQVVFIRQDIGGPATLSIATVTMP
jgi:hypothetical protein